MTIIKANVQLTGYAIYLVSKAGKYSVHQSTDTSSSTLKFDNYEDAEAYFNVVNNTGYC